MAERDSTPATERDFYTIDQLADFWQVSPKTVRRKIKSGELVAHKFGVQIRIRHADRITYERLNRIG